MQKSVFATLAFVSAIGAASGAMAASNPHHLRKADAPAVQKVAPQNRVMSEKPIDNPSLTQVFGASDGVFYDPATNDLRTHGLPNF